MSDFFWTYVDSMPRLVANLSTYFCSLFHIKHLHNISKKGRVGAKYTPFRELSHNLLVSDWSQTPHIAQHMISLPNTQFSHLILRLSITFGLNRVPIVPCFPLQHFALHYSQWSSTSNFGTKGSTVCSRSQNLRPLWGPVKVAKRCKNCLRELFLPLFYFIPRLL